MSKWIEGECGLVNLDQVVSIVTRSRSGSHELVAFGPAMAANEEGRHFDDMVILTGTRDACAEAYAEIKKLLGAVEF